MDKCKNQAAVRPAWGRLCAAACTHSADRKELRRLTRYRLRRTERARRVAPSAVSPWRRNRYAMQIAPVGFANDTPQTSSSCPARTAAGSASHASIARGVQTSSVRTSAALYSKPGAVPAFRPNTPCRFGPIFVFSPSRECVTSGASEAQKLARARSAPTNRGSRKILGRRLDLAHIEGFRPRQRAIGAGSPAPARMARRDRRRLDHRLWNSAIAVRPIETVDTYH